MTTNIVTSSPLNAKVDVLLIATRTFTADSLPWHAFGVAFLKLCKGGDPHQTFTGASGQIRVIPTFGQIPAPVLVLVGLGDGSHPHPEQWIGKAVRQVLSTEVRHLGFHSLDPQLPLDRILLAVREAEYTFSDFKPKSKKKVQLQRLTLFTSPSRSHALQRAEVLAEAVLHAKQIANQPPNLFTPEALALEARKLSRTYRLKCDIWNLQRLKKEKFGGILAVGQGSHNEPRFIRMDYRGGHAKDAPYVVIGKAITFDTGGISIKPSDRMDEMKFDKCGGIAVLGIMEAVARLRLPLNVTGLISSAENMPSGTSYRPGDLIPTLSGKYVEVLNTDAEGRIVLADALTYAHKLRPAGMVDLATLTGACLICFGHECAAVLGNQSKIIDDLRDASKRTGERIWPLPIWEEYKNKVKSDVAYVKNTGGREGGTITAACFLDAFVDAKIPWAHLDIAGMAWTSADEPHRTKGATGFGIRLVTNWLEAIAGEQSKA